ncbi:hypothetical protein [Amycolatopsis sp. NPDC004079]|uniref:hypothetical protein n=1 Tax=Amycolatopsis sp. NPDC004079 TaxID=3154549 RepID=UPI0033B6CDBF
MRALVRWLPADEREDIVVGISTSLSRDRAEDPADGPDSGDDADGAGEAAPDWDREWKVLLASARHADLVARLLGEQRAFFDYRGLARAARKLRDRIDDAYNLLCEAPRLDGLRLERGDDMGDVRRAVDLRRGEIVDAELAPLQPSPAPGAEIWTINYDQRGGFVADSCRSPDGTEPWRVTGMASTAAGAEHTLTRLFLHRPPEIRLRAPEPPRSWAETGWKSDRSAEGPTLRELLALRGLVYEEHLAACRAAQQVLREHASNLGAYLADRAAELNARDPQLRGHGGLRPIGTSDNRDHYGSARTVTWVPTRSVVGTGHSEWGEFGDHRPEVPLEIAEGLLRAADLEAFTAELFGHDISLLRTPAWAGPLYRIGSNGNHRIHAAKLLKLPWLATVVYLEATAPVWEVAGIVAADRDTGEEHPGSFERRVDERIRAIEGLLRRGVIDGDLHADGIRPVLRCTRLPASWLLRAPGYAARVNTLYERCYPGALAQLGVPPEVGFDPQQWERWLIEP